MKKVLCCLFVFCLCLSMTGCATIITGKHEKVKVTSNPPGATVRTDSGEIIKTPGNFTLERNEDHVLVAEYPGAESQQKNVKHGVQGWFFGNIIFGGIIGGVVDIVSGSCDHLSPKEVHFDFTESGQALASKREAYLQANPDIEKKYLLAIDHGAVTVGMNKEQVVLALGEPKEKNGEPEKEEWTYQNPKPVLLTFKEDKLTKMEEIKG